MRRDKYLQLLFLLGRLLVGYFAFQPSQNPPMKDTIVLLDPVTEWRPVLEAALRLNFSVIAVQISPISDTMAAFHPTESTLKEAGATCLLDRQDRDVFACVQALQLQKQANFKAVIPLSETAVDFSDTIAACLGLRNHNPLDLVLCKRDKGFMKQAVAKAGLPVAKFARLWRLEELEPSIETLQLEYPIVIKTPQGFSTTDVFVCSNPDKAKAALQKILCQKGPDGRSASCALLEQYIGGTEFAVNLIATVDGLLVTDVWRYDKTDRARYNSAQMCDPNNPRFHEICEYAKSVAQAVGVVYGAAHVELKAQETEDRIVNPILMEVGARLSGGRKATMTQAAYQNGFDPFEALIQSHTGTLEVSKLPSPPLHVEHLFLPIEKAGRVKTVHSILDENNLQTVHSHFLLVKEGEFAAETTDITSCAGFVWLVGEREMVDREAKEIRSSFWVEMEEGL